VVKVKIEFFFLFVKELDLVFYACYLCFPGCDLCTGGSVRKTDVGVFGDYVFGEALFVKVQVCTGIQEFGSGVLVEVDGFCLTSYTFEPEVFHPEVFVQ